MSQCLSLADGVHPADFEEASILFVGPTTVILRYGGFTVLVDPSFLDHGDHFHLGYGLASPGPTDAALSVGRLAAVDLVLLTRLREGRSDRRVGRELDRRLPILTTPRAATTLRRKGFVAVRGLAAWETIRVERAGAAVRVTSVPAPHDPATFEAFLPDVMGSMLEFARQGEAVGLRVHVSADAVVHGDLREGPRGRPGVDLTLVDVDGTRVLGIPVTEQGVDAVRVIGPRTTAPAPGDDRDVLESPLETFAAEVRRAGLRARVVYVPPGEVLTFRPEEPRALPGTSPGVLSLGHPAAAAQVGT